MNFKAILLSHISDRRVNSPKYCIALPLSAGDFAAHFFNKTVLYIVSFIAIALCSCREKNESESHELPSTDLTVFYPVQEYFHAQIKSVDTSIPRIYMITNTNGQKDSADINVSEFDKIAQTFLENNIADSSVKKYYRQSVFWDETTGSYTFNYTCVNSSLPVQNLDVLLDTTTQTVKRVFITKVKIRGDSTITEKLSWKSDNNFLINRMIQLPRQNAVTQQISVAWHDNN